MISSDRLSVWAAAVRLGLRTLPAEPVLGLKRLLLPVNYWRTAEFPYVVRHLAGLDGGRVLDLGSPKALTGILARERGFAVTAVDIQPDVVDLSRRYAAAQGIAGRGPGRIHSEVQDGRALDYPDDTFDAAYSVSVLEHIPGHGDTEAIAELVRVVKPGGPVIVTVPYDRSYRETWVERSVYERERVGSEKVFFQRHYDEQTLAKRLLCPSGAIVEDLQMWGEPTLPVESLLARAGRLRLPVSPLEPALSGAFLHQVSSDASTRPMAAFFRLTKPSVMA